MSRLRAAWIGLAFILLPTIAFPKAVSKTPEYVSLKKYASGLGLEYKWIENKKQAKLSNKWVTLELKVHQRYVLFNGIKIYLGYPIIYKRGSLQISKADYLKNVLTILSPSSSGGIPKLKRIVLDAGHGGHDPGASSPEYKINEKTMALDVTFRMKRMLEGFGYEVFLTRNDDKFISLAGRSEIANELQADLFISLHFNALKVDTVNGVETYSFTPAGQPSSAREALGKNDLESYPGNRWDTWNALIGYYVQSRLVKELGAVGRGLKRARFGVLKNLKCPGILVEGGFLTNLPEAKRINTEAYREQLAKAVANGAVLYHKSITLLNQ